jgi:hypothetical protein
MDTQTKANGHVTPWNKGELLGHSKLENTVRYLGIEVDDALEIAEQTEVQYRKAGRDRQTPRSRTCQLQTTDVAAKLSGKRPLR